MSDPHAHDHGHGQGHGGHGDTHGHDKGHAATPPAPPPKPGAVVIGFLVLLVGEVIILANSGLRIPSVLPEPVSTYAGSVDQLFYAILAITGFFFLLTEGLLVYFIVKYRAREGGRSRHTHGSHALELTWTFIPGLILFALAVFQTGTWGMIKFKGRMPHESDPDVEVIRVFAKQFEWHFGYRGPDGEFGTADDFVKLAELHVPVGRKVIVKLQTRDVIHSFWLPNARLKQDLLPGRTISQWFEITKPGRYPVVCAELCGVSHTNMGATLVAESEADYRAWVAEQAKTRPLGDPKEDPMWKFWRQQ